MQDFEAVYQAYFGDVFRYALRLTEGDRALAEDLTGDCFLKAMGAIHGFRGECELRVWLCQILKRLYLDHLRRQGRQAPVPLPDDLPDPADLEARFEQADEAMRAHQALHNLPEPYREVFSLRVMGGLSFKQIGQLFGKTDNWACVTYHRARGKLKDELEENDEH